ncbi:MAG: hypothetical protein V1820_04680 [archaeon]
MGGKELKADLYVFQGSYADVSEALAGTDLPMIGAVNLGTATYDFNLTKGQGADEEKFRLELSGKTYGWLGELVNRYREFILVGINPGMVPNTGAIIPCGLLAIPTKITPDGAALASREALEKKLGPILYESLPIYQETV